MATRQRPAAVSVEAFIAALDHPLKADIDALRELILSTDARIGEAVKWNAPSFHAGEHFATMRLNGREPLQLILHLGPKKSALPPGTIADPTGLLRWLGPDRACVNFAMPGEVQARGDALRAILRQWIGHVPARGAG